MKAALLTAAVACLLSWTSEARALGLHVGVLGGYGFTTEDSDLDPYSVGLGGRAGLTLSDDFALYLGGRLLWFAGDTDDVQLMQEGSAASASVELSRSYLTYGVDIGYDISLGPLLLRPELGLGGATLYSNQASTAGIAMVETTEGSFYLAPGLELLFAPSVLYLGAEVRYMALTESGQVSGLAILAHLGITI